MCVCSCVVMSGHIMCVCSCVVDSGHVMGVYVFTYEMTIMFVYFPMNLICVEFEFALGFSYLCFYT